MKTLLTSLWSLIKETFLFFGGGFCFIVFGLIGMIYTLVKHLWLLDYSISKQFTPMIRVATLLADCFANAGAGEMLNDILKVKNNEHIRYGIWYQTISAVTGLRYIVSRIDNKFRVRLDKYLGKNHCELAITPPDLFYYQKNNF